MASGAVLAKIRDHVRLADQAQNTFKAAKIREVGTLLPGDIDPEIPGLLNYAADLQLQGFLSGDFTRAEAQWNEVKGRILAWIAEQQPGAPQIGNTPPIASPVAPRTRTITVPDERGTIDMADPITGVDDPLAAPPSRNGGPDVNFGLWDDIKSGAGWAWDKYKQLQNSPPSGAPNFPVPQPPPGIAPTDGFGNVPDWYKRGQQFRNQLLGTMGNGNGNGPLPNPLGIPTINWMNKGIDYFGPGGNFWDGNGSASMMMPGIVSPAADVRLKAPKGYVIVTIPYGHPMQQLAAQAGGVQQDDGSIKVAMQKCYARDMKLWKPRSKPPMTAADKKTIRKARTLRKRAAKLAADAGVKTTELTAARKNC